MSALASMLDEPLGLERVLGDPHDVHNPCGYAQALVADERHEMPAQAEAVLDAWCLNAEFVPAEWGGRFVAPDQLIRRLRPLFRRDAALGLGYGVTSLMAAVNVWAGGSPDQQRQAARLLLGNRKIAVAYHELEHGNDLLRNGFKAQRAGARYVLDGRKEVINNAKRAAAMVLFARTDASAGGRSHSLLWLTQEELQQNRVRYLPRYRTTGVRGCQLGGIQFDDVEVCATSLIGNAGAGTELALRSFQLTRTVLPGLALGTLDTALRTTLQFAIGRVLYGQPISELPHARDRLAAAFADLIAADCLVQAAARSLQILPRQSAAHSAAVKYLVPIMIEDCLNTLSVILGARAYLRSGPHAIFGKHLRDVPALSLGHGGGTACLMSLIPQLPLIARAEGHRNFSTDSLFGRQPCEQRFQFAPLVLLTTEGDSIVASLATALQAIEPANDEERTALDLIDTWHVDAGVFRTQCRAIPASERSGKATAETFALASRYTLLLAAGACVGTWLVQRLQAGNSFLSRPHWLLAALTRLRLRWRHMDAALPPAVCEELFVELLRRYRAAMAFDLDGSPLADCRRAG